MDMESFEGWVLPAHRFPDLFGEDHPPFEEGDAVLLSVDDVSHGTARRLGRSRTIWLTASLMHEVDEEDLEESGSEGEEELELADGEGLESTDEESE